LAGKRAAILDRSQGREHWLSQGFLRQYSSEKPVDWGCVRDAYLDGLENYGWNADPPLAELGLCTAAVKYDWLTPAMLSSASAPQHMRYGGTEEIDPDFLFRQRGIALLGNAQRARRGVALAQEIGL
jgi:hypothetical protein